MPLTTPPTLVLPFADGGLRNVIPVAPSGTLGEASFELGFPLATMLPIASGGIPPQGKDMNGALYDVSAHAVWLNAGGTYKWNQTVSDYIGGYPVNVVLQDDAGINSYVNILAGNTTNFNTTPAAIGVSWMPWNDVHALSNYLIDTGAANAYVVAFTPALTARRNGQRLAFIAVHANSTSCTLNDGVGAIPLVRTDGSNLAPLDIPAGSEVNVIYDHPTTSYRLLSVVLSQLSGLTAMRYITTTVQLSVGYYGVNSTSGPFTATLPLNPTLGDIIEFRDLAAMLGTNPMTLARNGQTIMAVAADCVVDVGDAQFTCWFNGSTWKFA